MIEAAERAGRSSREEHAGRSRLRNTGIALAMVAAAKGYKLSDQPDTMSKERRAFFAYGSEAGLRTPARTHERAIKHAEEIAAKSPTATSRSKFKKPGEPGGPPRDHALEVWNGYDGEVDY